MPGRRTTVRGVPERPASSTSARVPGATRRTRVGLDRRVFGRRAAGIAEHPDAGRVDERARALPDAARLVATARNVSTARRSTWSRRGDTVERRVDDHFRALGLGGIRTQAYRDPQ